MIRLSIIITFFNAEKYIQESLESVYNQNISEEEYEVICVNNCSTDNSRDIVLMFQKEHRNLTLIEHERNTLAGGSRNTGIKAAKGKYLWYVDSDDYIEKGCFKELLEILETDNLEILGLNTKRVVESEIVPYDDQYFPFDTNVISGLDYLAIDFPYWRKPIAPWSKIFKLSFLKKNNLYFPEGVFMEDSVHTLKSLLVCSRLRYIKDDFYFYRKHALSMTNFKPLGGIMVADHVRFEIECTNILNQNNKIDLNLKNNLVFWYMNRLKGRKKSILYLPLKEFIKFQSRLKDIDKEIFKKYMLQKDYAIYVYPNLFLIINLLFFQILRPIRDLKRHLFDN
jgi:glycosyltransferase involved in cell wall biosynthesis